MKFSRKIIFYVFAFISFITASRSQTSPNLENGWKPYGSYEGSHLDTVNLMNGNVMLHAPLTPDYPQRGRLTQSFALYVSSKTAISSCNPQCYWLFGGAGVVFQEMLDISVHRMIDIDATTGITTASSYSLTSADGATHQLYDTSGTQTTFESVDATGYYVALSNPDTSGVPTTAVVTDRTGILYEGTFVRNCTGRPGPPFLNGSGYGGIVDNYPVDKNCRDHTVTNRVTDANGNQILRNTNIDTLGRIRPPRIRATPAP